MLRYRNRKKMRKSLLNRKSTMGRNIIILGSQRSGKTTLTKLLCQRESFSVFSVDALVFAFEHTMPELKISKKTKISEKSRLFAPFIAAYFENFIKCYQNQRFIIECCQLLPDDVCKQSVFKDFSIVCLGYPDKKPEEVFRSIRKNDQMLTFSYTQSFQDNDLFKVIPEWIDYGRYLQSECLRLSIPFYRTGDNREEVLLNVAETLL